jgi:hypothetical protein
MADVKNGAHTHHDDTDVGEQLDERRNGRSTSVPRWRLHGDDLFALSRTYDARVNPLLHLGSPLIRRFNPSLRDSSQLVGQLSSSFFGHVHLRNEMY